MAIRALLFCLTLRPAAVPDLLIYVAPRFMALLFYDPTTNERTSERKKHNARKVVLFFNPFFNAHNLQLLCGSNGLRLCIGTTYAVRVRSPERDTRKCILRRFVALLCTTFLPENYLDF